jgi:hypothetical protein
VLDLLDGQERIVVTPMRYTYDNYDSRGIPAAWECDDTEAAYWEVGGIGRQFEREEFCRCSSRATAEFIAEHLDQLLQICRTLAGECK